MKVSSITSKGIRYECVDEVARAKAEDNAKKIAEGGTAILQEKEVTVNGVVTPDEGFDGLSKVTVDVQVPDTKIVRDLVIKAGWSFCQFYTSDESTELLFNQFNTNVDSYRGKSLLMKTIEGVKAYGGYEAYFSDDPSNYSKFRLNADAFNIGEEIPLVFYYNDPTGLDIVPTNVVYKVVKIIPFS